MVILCNTGLIQKTFKEEREENLTYEKGKNMSQVDKQQYVFKQLVTEVVIVVWEILFQKNSSSQWISMGNKNRSSESQSHICKATTILVMLGKGSVTVITNIVVWTYTDRCFIPQNYRIILPQGFRINMCELNPTGINRGCFYSFLSNQNKKSRETCVFRLIFPSPFKEFAC